MIKHFSASGKADVITGNKSKIMPGTDANGLPRIARHFDGCRFNSLEISIDATLTDPYEIQLLIDALSILKRTIR